VSRLECRCASKRLDGAQSLCLTTVAAHRTFLLTPLSVYRYTPPDTANPAHSARNAITGSTTAARRAGRYDAQTATKSRMATADAKITGSVGPIS
jgi:hypothetical protein